MTVAIDPQPIEFRPLAMDDLPLMHRWLSAPHVHEWWSDARTPEEIRAKYAPRIAGAEPVRCFAIELGGRPIGYIQTYRICDYPDYSQSIGMPVDCAGIDLFIGEPELVGHGIGTRVLGSFLRSIVFADPTIRSCAIGPEPKNRRAIRAYEKAGFRHWKTVPVAGEPQPEYVMLMTRRDLESR
jgi:RimJ/RimL family protein N-acetyltransferase